MKRRGEMAGGVDGMRKKEKRMCRWVKLAKFSAFGG